MATPFFQRVDNKEIAKMQILKILSNRISGPFITNLGTKHPWVKGIQGFYKLGQ